MLQEISKEINVAKTEQSGLSTEAREGIKARKGSKKILLVKETKAEETRVALTPDDAHILNKSNFHIIVESGAGRAAGFSDEDYAKAGCEIRKLYSLDVEGYSSLFKDIDVVIRAKRPDHAREKIENQVIKSGTVMIGALDPLERDSTHMDDYKARGITPYSIDQDFSDAKLPNILSSMSKIAGRLAMLDALNKFQGGAKTAVIVGFGMVGYAAYETALEHNLSITIIGGETITRVPDDARLKKVSLKSELALNRQQEIVKNELAHADVVITGARQANTLAPILLPLNTLQLMPKGSVVVDMALSEGGNVEGSKHDETLILGNGVLVTNVSGYPKAMPHEASIEWSKISLSFIQTLIK